MTMEFLENAIPGVFIINAITLGRNLDGLRVSYVNASFADLFGSSRGAFVGRPILPGPYWVRPAERVRYLARLHRKRRVHGMEVELKRGDGSRFWVKLFSKVLNFHEGAFQIQGTLIDISIQKQLENRLRRYQQNLEKMVEERTLELEQACRELEKRNRELDDLIKKVTFLEAIQRQMVKFVPRTVKDILEKDPEMDMTKQDRDVSVLFLDIKGCTHLCEKLGPYDMNYILERYFSAFVEDIHRYLGDVNETMGDGLMAIYQGKGRVENALNAVRSALSIVADARRINRELAGRFPPLQTKVGISSGTAAVGATKFVSLTGDRWTYTATGPVTNLSSRLCSAAGEGEILIDEETAERIRPSVRAKKLGERLFKNIGSPVTVFRIPSSPPAWGSSPRQSERLSHPDTPLVGKG